MEGTEQRPILRYLIVGPAPPAADLDWPAQPALLLLEAAPMATPPQYRDALRRSHRLLASYFALWAWQQGVDCIALPRNQLLPFLRLKAMRNQRVNWLKDDIKDLFPHAFATEDSNSSVYATLYLSRKEIPLEGRTGEISDVKRAEKLTALGLATAVAKVPN